LLNVKEQPSDGWGEILASSGARSRAMELAANQVRNRACPSHPQRSSDVTRDKLFKVKGEDLTSLELILPRSLSCWFFVLTLDAFQLRSSR
jgi:hypothetical protein